MNCGVHARRARNCALLRIRAEADLRDAAEVHRQDALNHLSASKALDRDCLALAASEIELRTQYQQAGVALEVASLRLAQLRIEAARLQVAESLRQESAAAAAAEDSRKALLARLKYEQKIKDFQSVAARAIIAAETRTLHAEADHTWLVSQAAS